MENFEMVPFLPKPSVGMPGHPGKRTQVTKVSLVPSFQRMDKAFGSFEKIPALPEDGMPGHPGKRTQVMKVSLVPFFSKKGTP